MRRETCTSRPTIVQPTSSWARWAITADKGGGSSELHSVYATPGTIAAYRTSRPLSRWNRTVVIKEVYETSTSPMTTGTVTHAQTSKGWFLDAFAGRGK